MTDTMTETETPKKKRASVAEKSYLYSDGESGRHAKPGTEVLVFKFADGETYEVRGSDLPPAIMEAAAYHGLSQKLGDSYAGAKGNIADARDAFETVLERLTNGDWVTVGEGPGTRPSMVADAVKAALEELGETVDEDRYAGIMEKVKGKDGREGALKNALVTKHYERIKAERAAEKAAKAAKNAEGADEDLSGF